MGDKNVKSVVVNDKGRISQAGKKVDGGEVSSVRLIDGTVQ